MPHIELFSEVKYYRGLLPDPVPPKNTPEELEKLRILFKDLERTKLPESYDSPYVTSVK